MGTVYLIHLDRPYRHARHYLGWARDLEGRLAHHRAGTGANFMRVVRDAGIGWRVVKTWRGDKHFERRIKEKRRLSPRLPRMWRQATQRAAAIRCGREPWPSRRGEVNELSAGQPH